MFSRHKIISITLETLSNTFLTDNFGPFLKHQDHHNVQTRAARLRKVNISKMSNVFNADLFDFN